MEPDQLAPPGGDVGGLVAGLCAKIDLHIGSTERLADTLEKQRRRPVAQPVFGRTTAAGPAPAAGILVLAFPLAGPDMGHFWYVRSIVIAGLAPTTTSAGRADVYVSSSNFVGQPSLAAIGSSDWRDVSLTIPNVAFYGRGELPLRLNEHLYVVISGGTSGQGYVAAVQFEDFEEGSIRESWDR